MVIYDRQREKHISPKNKDKMSDIAPAQAIAILIGLMLAYAWGYRSGVAYCARELKKTADNIHKALHEIRK
jgi:hypothetical protein